MSGRLHRIEVQKDAEGQPEDVRFVCDGDKDSSCHHWPDCDCETWGQEHGWPDGEAKPGHGNVQQDSCWIDPWLNGALSDLTDWLEAYEGAEGDLNLDDLRSAFIETTFQGDFMTWAYAS